MVDNAAICCVLPVFLFDLGRCLMVTLGGLDITLLLGLMAVRWALASRCVNCILSWRANWSIMTSRCLVDAFWNMLSATLLGSWKGLALAATCHAVKSTHSSVQGNVVPCPTDPVMKHLNACNLGLTQPQKHHSSLMLVVPMVWLYNRYNQRIRKV